MWKGFQCRKSLIPECDQIYQRLKKANQAADPVKTLASRAKAALRTLTCARTTLFSILKALEELGKYLIFTINKFHLLTVIL